MSILGLGEMGRALAAQLLDAGHAVTVWNRSPGKAADLVARGARPAATPADAVRATDLVVVCLLDAASVHAVLDPVGSDLAGRTLVNLTTTTPDGSRELAAWAASAGADFLDGGILAVPEMIGGPGSSILYSGSSAAFDRYGSVLERWGSGTYLGPDAGLAALYDLALLAGMYVMFAGFLHGAAMVAPAGVSATEFAARAAPWLTAMTGAFAEYAAVVDGGDYTVAGQQSLEFSDLGDIVRASVEQGIAPDMVAAVQRLVRRQIDAGHGREGFARLYESIRHGAAAG
jgi:3-hydroxyisobutyrate dehydrogenase-like beta-hydroxyacid dehydrogenase